MNIKIAAKDLKALRAVRKDEDFMQLDFPLKEITDAELVLALFRMGAEIEAEDKGFEHLEHHIVRVHRRRK